MSVYPKIWTTPNQKCTTLKIIQIHPKARGGNEATQDDWTATGGSHLGAALTANLKEMGYGV
jgi:hypothetical protein